MDINFFKEPLNHQKKLGLFYKQAMHYITLCKDLKEAYELRDPEIREVVVEIITMKAEQHGKAMAESFQQAKDAGEFEEDSEQWEEDVWEEEINI